MTQVSMPWDGVAVGDAVQAPYDAANEWADMWKSLSGAGGLSNYRSGVFMHELNGLAPAISVSSPVTILDGRALVYGTWYQSNASEQVVIPTPGAATRYDYIVLRKTWATKEVRLARVAGVEGAGVPSPITQSAGVAWDMALCIVAITTGGVITITDVRSFIGIEPSVPFCSVGYTANQLIPDSSATRQLLNTAIFESPEDSGMWDAGAPTRITIPFTGIWRIEGYIAYDAGVSGSRQSQIRKNAAGTIIGLHAVTSAVATYLAPVVFEGVLLRDEYVELYAVQTGVVAGLNSVVVLIDGAVGMFPRFTAKWVRNRY